MKMINSLLASTLIAFGSCSAPSISPIENGKDVNPQPEQPVSKPETSEGKILVVYYSYTGNTRAIVADLQMQINCDVLEVIPEGTYDYNANNYKIGADQINAINANPDKVSSYPAIKENTIELGQYSTIIVATPLWHARMASNMQTLLFQHGKNMAGKRIGLIVSSHSSGISGVESDAKRLIPEGKFTNSLWINASNHSNRASLIRNWLTQNAL